MKVAAGGFHHETNTSIKRKTALADFLQADDWPELTKGAALPAAVAGINIPIAGFMEAWQGEITPLLWCSAKPGGAVEEEAFERVMEMMLSALKAALPLDAVYLDLHGAMVTEKYPDGEGEILRRVREVAEKAPIAVSLDLHANVTPEMFRLADFLFGYRSYPHTDMAENGRKVATILKNGLPEKKSFHKFDFSIPLIGQCTLAEPAKFIYSALPPFSSFFMGFPLAETGLQGPSFASYGEESSMLIEEITRRKNEFTATLFSPEEAIKLLQGKRHPVILADVLDNPGAGASSTNTFLLEALLRHEINSVIGLFHSPETAEAAHKAGIGKEIELPPLRMKCRILALGDGNFTGTGPMYGGSRMRLGKMALLGAGPVKIAVSSVRQQLADRSMLHHLGIQPENEHVIAVKSSVHFRADFQEMAGDIIMIDNSRPLP